MSEVSDVAVVRMLMAEHVSVDQASKKLSIVGGGIIALGSQHGGGATSPFGLFVSIAVPAAQYDEAPRRRPKGLSTRAGSDSDNVPRRAPHSCRSWVSVASQD